MMSVLTIQAQAKEEVETEGKRLLSTYCSSCHGVNRISSSLGYDVEDWRALIGTMVNMSSVPEQQNRLVAFLAENYPPNTHRKPVLVDGTTNITFKEWIVPTLGQRSRDPVEGPDGGIWWVGQWGDILGRIDPESGVMKEFSLPAGAKPHSVTIGLDGSIWYTGNKNATMGRLDPKTGKIKEYPMPDLAAKDPHTAVFDEYGVLWFTLQHSNRVGKLNPDTGEIKLATMPHPKSKPYGIKVAANGDIWVACNGRNCLVKIDPVTMEMVEIALPHEGTTVRRLDIDAMGMIWYVNSGRGRLGRYNPINGEIKEWSSPSGPKSHPYAIAVTKGVIWYNESGMRPDSLVRFDPKTEKFQSWAIPSGQFYSGIIRHMRPTKTGDLLIHQSATNRIIEVTIAE